MKKILKSQKGSILLLVVALILVFVSIISSVSLIGIVQTDHLQTQYQNDMIQEELLIRSEVKRSHLCLEFDQNRPLPDRSVEIITQDRITTYNIKNNKKLTVISNFMGYATAQAVAISSLITAKRARRFGSSNKSPVKRYSERLLRNESLAQFQYFTNTEESENADGGAEAARVKFWGPDVLHGKVHSNDDIWIQQAGGGNNNGWPTFWEMVTTSGIFRHHPSGIRLEDSGAPMNLIFRYGPPGWEENVPVILFEPKATEIRAHGIRPFNPSDDIIYVKIDGTSFSSWCANIQFDGVRDIKVYSWYPMNAAQANAKALAGDNWFEESNHIRTNHVIMYDTLWTPGPSGIINNQSVFVESELWIEGNIAGKQTWGCSDTIFIVGDITYNGTGVGQPPDDPDNPNMTDFFGLVSEKRVIIRYKHRDPETNEIMSPNCSSINLYGAFAAIGRGDPIYGDKACHHDGIFTFQYHHPHGSTPNFTALSPYTLQDTLYTFIDFHKYIYKPSGEIPGNLQGFILHGAAPPDGYPCGYNYESPAYINSYPNNNPYNYTFPYGTDWPWYNPVWPEPRYSITYERGTINIFGAIAQTRRGFVHRSGYFDNYNHPQGNSVPSPWDIENFRYDGNHPSTGYQKNYHYDQRFLYIQPPDYPQIYKGFGEAQLASFDEQAWFLKVPPE